MTPTKKIIIEYRAAIARLEEATKRLNETVSKLAS